MKNLILSIVASMLCLLFSTIGNAQQLNPLNSYPKDKLNQKQQTLLKDYAQTLVFWQDTTQTKEYISSIQSEYNKLNFESSIILPNFKGQKINFHISNSRTLSDDFQRKQAGIKTFKGTSSDENYTLRLTLSQMGIMAKITEVSTKKSWYIMPLDMHQPQILVMYDQEDPKIFQNASFNCQVLEAPNEQQKPGNIIPPLKKIASFGDCQLRSYRFAVAASAEYTNWAGSQANAMTNIANTVNNINEVYERDLTVHLNLYTQNSIVFTNSATQPYNFNSGFTSTLLNSNINVLDGAYTSSGYDLGMLFHFGIGGGLAYLSVVCTNFYKGGGVSGLQNTSQISYFETTAMHEIGHEFSAGHSMSANTGSCGGGNYMSGSSIEAGGGSTIMSYAGNCGVLAYQSQRIKYFHTNSIAQMQSYIGTTSCAQTSNSNNTAPLTNTSNKAYNIPHSTPFKLSMTATSANNNLEYSFDQMDLYGGNGISTPPSPTATFGPLFQTRIPSEDSFRYLPSLSVLLGEESGAFEVLPTVARAINFTGVVRDNHPGSGCKGQEDILVSTKNCGPFGFTNLNTATTLTANGTNTVTLNWNTANACVPTSNVKILFSTDGGKNYPYVILNSTPNDGTETIIVPNLSTCKGRFMIAAIGNIHFNINNAPITINSSCSANGAKITPDNNLSEYEGSPLLNLSLSPQYGTAITLPMNNAISTTDPASNLIFLNTATNTCTQSGNSNNYQAFEFYPASSGNYTFTLGGTFGLLLNLYNGSFNPGSLCSGFISSTATRNGSSGPVTLGNSFTLNLCAKQKYTLVVSSFGNGTPSSLPANYSINVTGGTIFNNIPNPGVSYNYGYVMVDISTGLIKEIKSTAHLSNTSLYPAGDYLIYGISTSSTLNSLNSTYANTSFITLSTNILNQTSGLCAQLSSNIKKVKIISPAPLNGIQLSGYVSKKETAILTWNNIENGIDKFIIERSTIGKQFSIVSIINQNNQPTILLEDKEFANFYSEKVFYRIKIVYKDGSLAYSNTISLYNGNLKNTEIEIFPNPIQNNSIQIQFNEATSSKIMLNLTDVLGKNIYAETFTKEQGVSQKNIKLQPNLPSGIYYLHIQKDGKTYSFKINKP